MTTAFEYIGSIKAKVIIALIIVVITTLTVFQLRYIINNNRIVMAQTVLHAEHIATRLALNLREPIWIVDEVAIKNIIDTEMLEKSIYAVSLNAEGIAIKGRQRDSKWQIINAETPVTGDFILAEKKITRYNETIGLLKVYLTNRFVIEKQKQDVYKFVFDEFILSIVLIALAVLAIVHTILRPLKLIANSVEDITRGNYESKLDLDQKDELGNLADGINHMKQSLQFREKERDHALKELEKKTQELALLNSSLEQKVVQRTQLLNRMTNEAQAANKAKSIFLANMSHELRTPLNAILGFSQLMRRDSNLSKEQHENMQIIEHSGGHLLHLINDILSMASIEAGKTVIHESPFNLIQLVEDVVNMQRNQVMKKGIELIIERQDDFPEYIISDETKIKQLILNLLTNAIKYTDNGKITIKISSKNRHDTNIELNIEVIDTGCGISEEEQQLIFNPFVQVGMADEHTGTGLGLAIAKQHIQMLNGYITISSEVGKGTTFTVSLPVTISDHIVTAAKVVESFNSRAIALMPGQPEYKILIGDSNSNNKLLLQRILKAIGLKAKVSNNLRELFKEIKRWHPDLIFLSSTLSDTDSISVVKQIRDLAHENHMVVILITSTVIDELSEDGITKRVDGYITRPYKNEDVYQCLETHLGVRYQFADEEAVDITPTTFNKKNLDYIDSELVKALEQATLELNVERSLEIITEISKTQPDTALALKNMVEQYQFQMLQELLSSSGIKG